MNIKSGEKGNQIAEYVRRKKRLYRVNAYYEIIDRIHSHGISVQAGLVFGFEHDTPEIFDVTIEFLEKAGVQNATFNILTPFPGTPLFRRMEAEGRILYSRLAANITTGKMLCSYQW